jgi:hypothetical protein
MRLMRLNNSFLRCSGVMVEAVAHLDDITTAAEGVPVPVRMITFTVSSVRATLQRCRPRVDHLERKRSSVPVDPARFWRSVFDREFEVPVIGL